MITLNLTEPFFRVENGSYTLEFIRDIDKNILVGILDPRQRTYFHLKAKEIPFLIESLQGIIEKPDLTEEEEIEECLTRR